MQLKSEGWNLNWQKNHTHTPGFQQCRADQLKTKPEDTSHNHSSVFLCVGKMKWKRMEKIKTKKDEESFHRPETTSEASGWQKRSCFTDKMSLFSLFSIKQHTHTHVRKAPNNTAVKEDFTCCRSGLSLCFYAVKDVRKGRCSPTAAVIKIISGVQTDVVSSLTRPAGRLRGIASICFCF